MAEYIVDVTVAATIRLDAEDAVQATSTALDIQGHTLDAAIGDATLTEVSVTSASVFEDPRLLALLDAVDRAADGDSNDAEIQAGQELASYIRRINP